MSEINEFRLCVPADLARQFSGLSIDVGSSMVKCVYKSKEDKEASASDCKYGHLHLVSYPRRELSAALEYIRQRAVITRRDDDAEPPTIYSTGIGCTQQGKQVSDTLNVKLQQLTEFDCFVKSFTHLSARLPRTEFLEPFLEEAIVEPVESVKFHFEMMKKMQDMNLSEGLVSLDIETLMAGVQLATGKPPEAALQAGDVPLSEAEPDMYPCLLAMCGSGYGFMKVEKDGSFKMIDLSNRGGRLFLGLGALLTGYKTFSELIEAASKGDQRAVDQFSNDLLSNPDSSEGDESMYAMYSKVNDEITPVLTFCFGKAVGSDIGKFKREDLARALLNVLILDLVQCVQLICNTHGIKRVFFSGGICSAPLVRSMITTEYVRRNLTIMSFGTGVPVVAYDFVKPGAHLGVLGCVVTDAQKSTAA